MENHECGLFLIEWINITEAAVFKDRLPFSRCLFTGGADRTATLRSSLPGGEEAEKEVDQNKTTHQPRSDTARCRPVRAGKGHGSPDPSTPQVIVIVRSSTVTHW